MIDSVVDIVLLLAILVFLVVIHELGHFFAARRAKVRVHEFGVGFPPRARVLHRGPETTWTLNWLPIGGFVRLEGEEGESADSRAFVNQPLRTRLLILVAGVGMNFLLAWVILSIIAFVGDPVSQVRIASVQPGSPAAAIGLVGGNRLEMTEDRVSMYDRTGDRIVAINGQAFPVFDGTPSLDRPLAYLRAHAGEEVSLTIEHNDGTRVEKTVLLRSAAEAATSGALGIRVNGFESGSQTNGVLDSIAIGFRRTIDASTLIIRGVAELISNIGDPQVAGPIGMVTLVGAYRELPPTFLFWLIALLSANLAVINILPFPPMDGGRAAVAIAQRLSGNRISLSLERAIYLTGFAVLMGLLVWISVFDIKRIAGG
ncbi:MAG: M50 family metallopeptidase [Chloroflexota bacterium]